MMGRRFIGVEINPDYKSAYKIICKNFSNAWLKVATNREADEQDRLEEGELILKLRQVKHAFDPHHLLNPGKVVDAAPMTENLRIGLSDKEPAQPPPASRDMRQ